jgi:23S rRNA (cytidine1920-2'-O)/16S rRNA (cytidine1409-2'-O)-methyltransferase
MAGQVLVNDQKIDKPGTRVPDNSIIRLTKKKQGRFVSRGGDKLYGAICDFGITDRFEGAHVLDIGASTGGFTDCCLQLGSKSVIALDVGVAQLDWKLRSDERVICLERTDIRDFHSSEYPDLNVIVGDISFNSITRLAPFILRAAERPGVLWLLLIKPQFELPRDLVPSGGIVKEESLIELANKQVSDVLKQMGVKELGICKSRVRGAKGNQECFILAEVASQL